MVLQTDVAPWRTALIRKEILPLLPSIHEYTPIQNDPKVLLLRNPRIPLNEYEKWQKDHRFGKFTCPRPTSPAWDKDGAIDGIIACHRDDDDDSEATICVSAMIIRYSTPRDVVTFHKDPAAYDRIVSLTVEGEGVMHLKRGRRREAYPLVPGKAIVLEEDDCHEAKHSVVCSSPRLGLVLRFANAANV